MSSSKRLPVSRHGLARVLSKRGLCSRTEAARWIVAGRVTVAGRVILDPDHPTAQSAVITVDDVASALPERIYLALNKPRGLVTSVTDERGRDTIYRCLDGAGLPWLAPVGRLDKASEGLLLLCNDPQWAALVASPDQGPDKVYHVQIDAIPDDALLTALVAGREEGGEFLRAKAVQVLRTGGRNAWLEVVLDRGRNRHIRRLLATLDVRVLRLVRVAIGTVQLGELPKGQWRALAEDEVRALAATA
ncbi:MAG: pseudouridine synthase [Xanthomonadaceae bacterium]|nr:pseudouridine synthase [Xanthomonadaceae bacterium]